VGLVRNFLGSKFPVEPSKQLFPNLLKIHQVQSVVTQDNLYLLCELAFLTHFIKVFKLIFNRDLILATYAKLDRSSGTMTDMQTTLPLLIV
jgi:hypothetical protein